MDSASWLLFGLAAAGVLLAIFAVTRRFRFRGGYWVRLRPRRRWSVGPRRYRLARSLGFRYSSRHDALVLRIRHGHFGPVLRLRPQESSAPAESQLPLPAEDPLEALPSGIADLTANAWSSCTIDLVSQPLPHVPRSAGLWQLTAVDVRSGFAWADVVRRRNGPTAMEIATFIERIANDLDATGQRLGRLIVHDPAAGFFEPGVLPADVRVLVPEPASEGGPGVAAVVQEELADPEIASAPSASLAHLRGRLHRRVGSYNASPPRFAGRPRARR